MKQEDKNKKKFFLAKAILPILLLSLFFASQFPLKASSGTEIYFNPEKQQIGVGETFRVESRINPSSDQVSAVEMHAIFDPTKLKLESVEEGGSFSSVLQQPQIDNSSGTVSIVAGIPFVKPTVPVISDDVVATLTFKLIGEGETAIRYSNQTIASALDESANVITSREGIRINPQSTDGRTYRISDFAVLAGDWGKKEIFSPVDLDIDGAVNSRDLGIMMSNWEK